MKIGSPIEVKVKSLLIYQQKNVAIILLEGLEGEWGLPILAKATEVGSINLTLSGQECSRPLSHDLMASIVRKLNAQPLHVLIDILEEPLCHGIIALDVQGREMDFDARPSDAISLALRARVPIYVSPLAVTKGAIYYNRSENSPDWEGNAKLIN